MPIYEYQCDACGQRFDDLVRADAPVPPCPHCASDSARRLVSAAAFHLKGGGWYKDHYGLKRTGTTSTGATLKAQSVAPSLPVNLPSHKS